MMITYEITFANNVYEIRCQPLSHDFAKYLMSKKIVAIEDVDKLVQEVISESDAAWLNSEGTYSKDFGKIPNLVLNAWLEEIIRNAQAKAEIRIKQQKN